MGQNFKLLNLPYPIFADTYVLRDFPRNHDYSYFNIGKDMNSSLVTFFRDMNYWVSNAMLFYSETAGPVTSIHYDGDGSFQFAINWVFCESHLWEWYKPLTVGTKQTHPRTSNTYTTFTPNEIELIEQSTDKGPTLVNIGNVPHRAFNTANEKRWCLSLRFIKDPRRSWESVVNDFSHLTIDGR